MDMLQPSQDLRLRRTVEAGELGLWDLRLDLETVHYSPQWKLRFGFPEPHDADSTHFWRCRVHPDDLEIMLTAMRAHLRGGMPCYEAEFRLRSNGSGYRIVHSRGRVIECSSDGRPVRMVGAMIDLTERPCIPRGGLPAGSRGAMAVSPLALPFHELFCDPAPPDQGESSMSSERFRVVSSVADLLQESLNHLDSLRGHRRYYGQ